MTQHVYVVARAGRCNGAALTIYADALSALSDAKSIADSNGWAEQEGPSTNAGQLWMAHGDGDEDWIEVQQQSVQYSGPSPAQHFVVGANSCGELAKLALTERTSRLLKDRP